MPAQPAEKTTFSNTLLEVIGGLLDLSGYAFYLDSGAQASLSGGQISINYGYVGYQSSPLTTFTQTGGTFSVKSDLAVGRQSSAQGLYVLQDGLLEVGTDPRTVPALRVGRQATGTFTQQGGTVRIPYGGLSWAKEAAMELTTSKAAC
ncbi:MAG: hypothetical protein NZ602_06515 [Thermoguttaceae bacterium]|nr:hypothetical protein [Thermoguttaceae bacterium]MDW8036934.1 hypothetical protein [Thermoguttaceae bacterium]